MVVIGAGGLGLICIAIIKAMKGKGAIAVDIDPVKREAAKRAGALAAVDPNAPDAVAADCRRRPGAALGGDRFRRQLRRPRSSPSTAWSKAAS